MMLGGNRSSELQDYHRKAVVSSFPQQSEGSLIQLPPSLSTSPSDQGNNTLTPFLHSTAIRVAPVLPAEVELPSSQINHHSRPPPRKSLERRRWSQEEHMLFLLGLELYENGDWINISRMVVKTRTPTQVASHAQKYFLHQASDNRGKIRSIHDITLQDPIPHRIDHQNLVASPNIDLQHLHGMHHLVPHHINLQYRVASPSLAMQHLHGMHDSVPHHINQQNQISSPSPAMQLRGMHHSVPHHINQQNQVASPVTWNASFSPSQHQLATLGSTQCNNESKVE